jgi:hypothetical protein
MSSRFYFFLPSWNVFLCLSRAASVAILPSALSASDVRPVQIGSTGFSRRGHLATITGQRKSSLNAVCNRFDCWFLGRIRTGPKFHDRCGFV